MRYCWHGPIKEKAPPCSCLSGDSPVENGKPRHHPDSSSRSKQTRGNEERVDYRLVASSPRNWSESRYLGADGEVDQGGVLGRPNRTHQPPHSNHTSANRDNRDYVYLCRTRETTERDQDPGILVTDLSPCPVIPHNAGRSDL